MKYSYKAMFKILPFVTFLHVLRHFYVYTMSTKQLTFKRIKSHVSNCRYAFQNNPLLLKLNYKIEIKRITHASTISFFDAPNE